MADCFVTGIAPTQDVTALEQTLGSVPGLDRARLTVLTMADRSDRHDRSFIRFIHLGGAELDAEMVGDSLVDSGGSITSSGGTGVPGIAASERSMGYLGHPRVEQHVGVLPIPEDEADNYNDALDDGRCVVAYKSDPANCAALEAAFNAAGLAKVKMFA